MQQKLGSLRWVEGVYSEGGVHQLQLRNYWMEKCGKLSRTGKFQHSGCCWGVRGWIFWLDGRWENHNLGGSRWGFDIVSDTVDWEAPVLGWLSILRRGRIGRQHEWRFYLWGSQVNFFKFKVKPRNVKVSSKGRGHKFKDKEGDEDYFSIKCHRVSFFLG